MKSAQEIYEEGDALFQKGKFREATKYFSQAIALDQKFMPAYRGQFRCYTALGEYRALDDWCDKALKIDPKYQYGLNSKGNALQELGRREDAIKYFDKAIKLYPKWTFPYNGKAECLSYYGKQDEAEKCYKKLLALDPNETTALRNLAVLYQDTDRYLEAKDLYDKVLALEPNHAGYLCERGSLLNQLGKRTEALKDFKRAHRSMQNGFLDVGLEPAHMEYIKKTLASIAELDNMSAKAEAAARRADRNNPRVKQFVADLEHLQDEKEKMTADLMSKAKNNDTAGAEEVASEIKKLKKQFEQLQTQLSQVKSDVNQIKVQLEDVKEELNNKMDDFNKKLDTELMKMDLAPDDQIKVKEYFKGFVETFSSIHVTSQVIDSGQVQIESDSSKATILSLIASFTPFIGGALSSGVKSIGDFLESKEMKTNARKMKGLAADATELSQLIGKSGYEIVMNQEKRSQIITISNEDLQASSDSLIAKITRFCDKLREDIDAYLYSRLYKTPSARLGHNDANELVELWIKGTISHYNIEKEFVKNATDLNKKKQKGQKEEKQTTSTSQQNRSNCCNLF